METPSGNCNVDLNLTNISKYVHYCSYIYLSNIITNWKVILILTHLMCLLFNIIREMLLFNIINEKLLFGALRLRQSFFTTFCPRFHKLSCQICESCFEQLLDSPRRDLFFFWLVPSACSFPFFLVPATFGLYRPESENPMPHPFQNNLCAAMLNIQAIYAGRG